MEVADFVELIYTIMWKVDLKEWLLMGSGGDVSQSLDKECRVEIEK